MSLCVPSRKVSSVIIAFAKSKRKEVRSGSVRTQRPLIGRAPVEGGGGGGGKGEKCPTPLIAGGNGRSMEQKPKRRSRLCGNNYIHSHLFSSAPLNSSFPNAPSPGLGGQPSRTRVQPSKIITNQRFTIHPSSSSQGIHPSMKGSSHRR